MEGRGRGRFVRRASGEYVNCVSVGCDVRMQGIPLGRRGSFLCGGFETRLVGFLGGAVFGAMFELFEGVFAIEMLVFRDGCVLATGSKDWHVKVYDSFVNRRYKLQPSKLR